MKSDNVVALLRLALLVPLFWLLARGGQFHFWAALSVFTFVGLAGLIEGFFRRTPFSPFCSVLHVLADRLLTVVVVVGLVTAGMQHALVLIPSLILIARDVIVGTLNEALSGDMRTPMLGLEKGRIGLQVVGLGFLIAPNMVLPDVNVSSVAVGSMALIVAAILAVVTLVQYWRSAVTTFVTSPD